MEKNKLNKNEIIKKKRKLLSLIITLVLLLFILCDYVFIIRSNKALAPEENNTTIIDSKESPVFDQQQPSVDQNPNLPTATSPSANATNPDSTKQTTDYSNIKGSNFDDK